ncbi:pilus assembly protein PilZ [Methylorubrum extorquens]
MDAERRRLIRLNGFRIGTLTLGNSFKSRECLVWNHNEFGALIEVEPDIDLPIEFALSVPALEIHSWCKVIWSEGREHGVEFVRQG